MPPVVGDRLGPYEILAPIGAGGIPIFRVSVRSRSQPQFFLAVPSQKK
jgi:hypothetical protein